jgi:hypothetical protein
MSQQYLPISLWLRLCRWLWKYPLPFLFSTLLINVAINIGSTLLITPATTKPIPDASLAGNITGWVSTHWTFSLLLGAISIALLLVTWLGSRKSESASSAPTQIQMSTRDRERMLKRLCVRYEQLLAQSFQGAVEIELGLASRPAAIQNAVSLSLVECPSCRRTWTISLGGGVLRFKAHKKRKTNAPNAGRRWARGERETDWDVVGG